MTIDEGYIKYQSHWTPAPAPDASAARHLEASRRVLYDAGLIGHYEELNIGFGNISVRSGAPGQFLITGTQTGHIQQTGDEHYSLVTQYDIDQNTVSCTGPVQASSEAMTHAAIYELSQDVGAVVHVHSKALWNEHLNRLPTTSSDIPYGTPAMAREFARLFNTTEFASQGVAVMGGHDEGLIGIGESLESATHRVMALLA